MKIAFGVLVIVFLCVYLTMVLWNWLMPELFGLTEITLDQAFGLIVLTSLLFYRPK